jgi:hypothetical protein
MTQKKELRFESEKDSNYSVTNVDGVFGTLTPNYGQIILFVDIPEVEMGDFIEGKGPGMIINKVKRKFLIDARMSPSVFKSIASWMNKHVERYENKVESGEKNSDSPIYQ